MTESTITPQPTPYCDDCEFDHWGDCSDPAPSTYTPDYAADYWNGIDQGVYDDDPNPYHGDYSEM
jgi:hypothetical protein